MEYNQLSININTRRYEIDKRTEDKFDSPTNRRSYFRDNNVEKHLINHLTISTMKNLSRSQSEVVYHKNGKIRAKYARAIGTFRDGVFRPVRTGWRNRHGFVEDETAALKELLELFG